MRCSSFGIGLSIFASSFVHALNSKPVLTADFEIPQLERFLDPSFRHKTDFGSKNLERIIRQDKTQAPIFFLFLSFDFLSHQHTSSGHSLRHHSIIFPWPGLETRSFHNHSWDYFYGSHPPSVPIYPRTRPRPLLDQSYRPQEQIVQSSV